MAEDEAAKDPEKKQPDSCLTIVKNHAALQVVGATAFAMGMAWRTATLAIVEPEKYTKDPSEIDNKGSLWGVTAIFVLIFLFLIAVLMHYRMGLEARLKDEKKKEDKFAAFLIKTRMLAIDSIVGWGLTFAVAAQIDTAMEATVPKDPAGWRILYLVLLIVFVCALTIFLRRVFKSKENTNVAPSPEEKEPEDKEPGPEEPEDLGPEDKEASDGAAKGDAVKEPLSLKVSDALLGGSGFVVALATLGVADALFELDEVLKSEDLGYIAIYTFVWIVVAALVLAMLARADARDATDAKKKAEASKAAVLPNTLERSMRKVLAKVFAMCPALASYAFFYVLIGQQVQEDGKASVYDPLSIKGAFIFLAIALALSAFGGLLIKFFFEWLAGRFEVVDRDLIEGVWDDTLLEALEGLTRMTSSSIIESFAWVVGVAMHTLLISLWDELVEDSTEVANILAMCGFGLVLSMLAVVSAICLTPKPKTA